MTRVLRPWLPGVAAFLLATCTESTGPSRPVATKVAFVVQPGDAQTADFTISPAIAVAIEDALGNTVTSARDTVTVVLGANPGGGTLAGTTSAAALRGVATFPNLSIDKAGSGYTLTAAAAGLTGATSASFDITPDTVSLIAFGSSRGIEVIHPDGSGSTVLIADSMVFDPAWSPDGTKLAFARWRADGLTSDIYVARVDGWGVQRIITSPDTSFPWAHSPSWSPNGTRIAFGAQAYSVPPGSRIYGANADGSNDTQVFADSNGEIFTLTWSPDAAKLAFGDTFIGCGEICSDVFVMNADGSNARTLTSGGCEYSPAWSPDGTLVAYSGSCENGGPYFPQGPFGLWVKNPDGSGARNLTDDAGGCLCDGDPAWSPDGARLVFARAGFSGNTAGLYIINRDGTGLRQLTSNGLHPAWRRAPAPAAAARLASDQSSLSRHP